MCRSAVEGERQTSDSPAGKEMPVEDDGAGLSPVRILIAEDNKVNQKLAKMMFHLQLMESLF